MLWMKIMEKDWSGYKANLPIDTVKNIVYDQLIY